MGTFFLILIIVAIVFWPRISLFLRKQASRFMARRAEDMMRRMMGMPSRREEERRKKEQAAAKSKDSASGRRGHAGGARRKSAARGARPYAKGRIAAMLQAVAVDIDFTEIREFSSSTVIADDGDRVSFRYEEQISDVKFTEIKGARP